VSRPRREGPPAYEPTVQFRPVPALSRMVKPLADSKGLALNEAYKNLAALAAVGLDVRYYDLVNQMAVAMGGVNAFVHACLKVYAALSGAAIAGRPYTVEPERSLFILDVVKEAVVGNGRQLPHLDLWFLTDEEKQPAAGAPQPASTKASAAKKRRTIRTQEDDEDREADRPRQRQ
jgi:hypothetical protein